MKASHARDLTHDLVLPTLLFATLGAMTWAVRGCSGYGAVPGCIFAGVTWGAAWWYLAQETDAGCSRRYASGWVVLALTTGIGLAGAQGWMQWPYFFRERLYTDFRADEFVAISSWYGFVWLFIAGAKWAGLGACMLAWTSSLRETRVQHWLLRIACAFGAAAICTWAYRSFPRIFLPLYESLETEYGRLQDYPSLKKLVRDGGEAVNHLGFCFGCLAYELWRRDWKNVVLILAVGISNGCGWALCQCWMWAPGLWPNASFNWWRCWESSGGISIGFALGIAYFLVNRRMSDAERVTVNKCRDGFVSNVEWLITYLSLASLLFLFIGFRLGGWGSIYFFIVMLFGAMYSLRRGGVVTENEATTKQALSRTGTILGVTVLFAGGLLFLPGNLLVEYGLFYVVLAMGACVLWQRPFSDNHGKQNSGITEANSSARSIEKFGLYFGLLTGLGMSVQSGLKGWFNIYRGDESKWHQVLWEFLGPVYLVVLLVVFVPMIRKPTNPEFKATPASYAYRLMWLVLIVQNTLAQIITGPLTDWNEVVFSIYYMLLFAITAVIVVHVQRLRLI